MDNHWPASDLGASVDFLDDQADADTDKRRQTPRQQVTPLTFPSSRRIQAPHHGASSGASATATTGVNEIRPLGGYGVLNAYASTALTHEWAASGG